mmetsp:Transcript_23592/g.26755  ORF Transcript_23592/g.26755 Transcript_23592/m.26755 type:complete len:115 (+) Transcript_23592:45-389(+)
MQRNIGEVSHSFQTLYISGPKDPNVFPLLRPSYLFRSSVCNVYVIGENFMFKLSERKLLKKYKRTTRKTKQNQQEKQDSSDQQGNLFSLHTKLHPMLDPRNIHSPNLVGFHEEG